MENNIEMGSENNDSKYNGDERNDKKTIKLIHRILGEVANKYKKLMFMTSIYLQTKE